MQTRNIGKKTTTDKRTNDQSNGYYHHLDAMHEQNSFEFFFRFENDEKLLRKGNARLFLAYVRLQRYANFDNAFSVLFLSVFSNRFFNFFPNCFRLFMIRD